jgi:hypothetical protein
VNSWRSRCLQPLIAGADEPRRTAAAFAVGTFLSFSPFLGFQIVVGFTIAYALRLSRPAMFVGLCTNLPWFMVPWYTLTTMLGAWLLGLSLPTDVGGRLDVLMSLRVYSAEFWERARDLVAPFFWAFVVGSVAAAVVMGVLAYLVAARFLAQIRLSRLAG